MIDDEDYEAIDCITFFNWTSTFVRVIDNVIIPSTIKFRIEFLPDDDATEESIETAFRRIRYWLEAVVNKSIVFAHHNVGAIKMFFDENGSNNRVINTLVVTPEEPDDVHLAALFQAKLRAIANGAMDFGRVDIQSDNSIGLTHTFVSESFEVLPDADEWFAERRYFDKPWWDRNDASTIDTVPAADADLSVRPQYAFTFDFLDQQKQQPVSGTIVRPEFRPKVIDGGKPKE